jgi:hypothetical protein
MKTSILLVTLVAASPAFADDSPAAQLGQPGHVAIDGSFSVSFGYVSQSPPTGSSTSATVFTVAPTLDYFVAPGISIGGTLELARASSSDSGAMTASTSTATIYGIGPRVGYHAPLGPQLSVWPRAGLLYAHETFSFTGSPDSSGTVITLVASAPLLYHPVPHFFIGIGPEIRVDVSSKDSTGGMDADGSKRTQLALVSTVGGWF